MLSGLDCSRIIWVSLANILHTPPTLFDKKFHGIINNYKAYYFLLDKEQLKDRDKRQRPCQIIIRRTILSAFQPKIEKEPTHKKMFLR